MVEINASSLPGNTKIIIADYVSGQSYSRTIMNINSSPSIAFVAVNNIVGKLDCFTIVYIGPTSISFSSIVIYYTISTVVLPSSLYT